MVPMPNNLKEIIDEINKNQLFDEIYYKNQFNEDLEGNLLLHYLF